MLCSLCVNNLDCFIRDSIELYSESHGAKVVVVQCEAFEPYLPNLPDELSEEELQRLLEEVTDAPVS